MSNSPDVISDAAYAEAGRLLGNLISHAHTVAPERLAKLVADEAALVGLHGVRVYLQDYDQTLLLPLRVDGAEDADPEPVDGSLAGQAFTTQQVVEEPRGSGDGGDGIRLWQPLLDGTERVGVLGLRVAAVDAGVRMLAARLAGLVAELLVTKGLYTDLYFQARRKRPTTLAAEMQWHLLPPLALDTPEVEIAGVLEPAYGVGGDAFDYAVNPGVLHLGIFDAMGPACAPR